MDVYELLKRHEGFSQTVYRCTANRQTIGYGRNLDDVGISRSEAEFLLKNDIARALASVSAQPFWRNLDEVRQAVLIDMCVNLGWGGLSKFARMLTAVSAGQFPKAADEMLDSIWAKQVPNRARRLAQMMRSGLWPSD